MKIIHHFFRNAKDGAINLYKGAYLFNEKNGTTLASSSTFYVLITIVPFLLLTVRGIGYFLGNINRTQKYIFVLGGHFFPDAAPQFLHSLQNMIKGSLFAGTQLTLINFFFLAISTITFLNSIWMGIYTITEDKNALLTWKILKGFVIVGITFIMVMILFLIPPLIIYIIKFVQTNLMTQFFYENFDFLRPFFVYVKTINLKKSYWLNSSFLHISLLIIYFTFLYRWLFSWKIQMKEAFIAALTFSLSIFFGKSLFWVYVYYVRAGLMRNYGDLYTTILGIIWIFYLMCFFFYGACICQVYRQRREGSHKKQMTEVP